MKAPGKKKRLFLILLFIITNSFFISAADYYWVGGKGNWSDYGNHWATTSGGVIFHTTIPSPFDDVYFDGNSASAGDTIYADTTIINCKSMDWTGVAPGIVFKGIGTIKIYGSLTLSGSMVWDMASQMMFLSGNPGNTITTSGVALKGGMTLNGTGSWLLMDSLVFNYGLGGQGIISISRGSFNTNNQLIRCWSLTMTSPQNTTVDLGTSEIYCVSVTAGDSTHLNLSATQAKIECQSFDGGSYQHYGDITTNGIDGQFCTYHDVTFPLSSGGVTASLCTFNDLLFHGDAFLYGENNTISKATVLNGEMYTKSNEFDTLIFVVDGKSIKINYGDTLTINNVLSANGTCSGLFAISSSSAGTGATILTPSGTIVCDYLLLQDIIAAGGGSFTANNSIDAGNVTGWVINSPAAQTLYWTGGTGDWNDISHWSASSGGPGGSCLPTLNDDVVFDSNSLSSGDTVKVNYTTIYCKSMDWTGVVPGIVFSGTGTIKIYGSLTLSGSMVWDMASQMMFLSGNPGNTITTSGVALKGGMTLNGTGSWLLMDSLVFNYGLGGQGIINISRGSFNTNNQLIRCWSLTMTSPQNTTVDLGTSEIYCVSVAADDSTHLNLSATQAKIECQSFDGGSYQHYGDIIANGIDGQFCTYHDVTFPLPSGGVTASLCTFNDLLFHGDAFFYGENNTISKATVLNGEMYTKSNEFDTLIFVVDGKSIKINYGDTLTINNVLSANGTCSGLFAISSSSAGTGATILTPSGTIVCDYLLLQDIIAAGGGSFTANNSIDAGNVTGWVINSPAAQTLYWTGGTGDWNDISHWSASSGGPGGSCLPTLNDDVVFDSNSLSSGDTVKVNYTTIYCKSMDWTGVVPGIVFSGTGTIKIYGSLTLSGSMVWDMASQMMFLSGNPGNTITTSGVALKGGMTLNGTGSWLLMDSLVFNYGLGGQGIINISRGSFNTNNQLIRCWSLTMTSPQNTTVDLGTSEIYCVSVAAGDSTHLNLSATQAKIECQSFDGGYHQIYGDITTNVIIGQYCTYHDVTFPFSSGTIHADLCTFNELIFYGDASITGLNNTIRKATVLNGEMYTRSNEFDTLNLMNILNQLAIMFGDTLTINNALYCKGTASFPITIKSTSASIQANISIPSGNACLEYLYIQGINATGGATFNAGDNSIDLGNNTGWTWTSCTPDTSNVWPGDANYDLTADNIDILYIGLAYGYTGPVRAGATTNWVAQPGIDWLQQFATGYNIKHADCDGNGTVDATDTAAVILNYGQVHPFKQPFPPTVTGFGTPLYFDIPPGSLTPGAVVDIPIMLGTAAEPADKIYGVAFTVNYDPALIQSGSMEITFGSSWFGTGANTIHINKDFYNNGSIDMAFVKTDHVDEAGFGTFATLHFILDNNASGPLNLSFSKILVLDKYEIPQPVNVTNGSIYTGIDDINASSEIFIYPNPVKEVLQINVPYHTVKEISMISMEGKKVLTQTGVISTRVNVGDLANGVYLLEVRTKTDLLRKKIVVEH